MRISQKSGDNYTLKHWRTEISHTTRAFPARSPTPSYVALLWVNDSPSVIFQQILGERRTEINLMTGAGFRWLYSCFLIVIDTATKLSADQGIQGTKIKVGLLCPAVVVVVAAA